jgi:hypothetical protein
VAKHPYLLRIDEETFRELRDLAEARGTSLAFLLRDIISGYLENGAKGVETKTKTKEKAWWMKT